MINEDEEDIAIDIPIKHESKPYLMIPFPDNATNGDVMKILFKVNPILDNQTNIMIVAFPDGFALYVPIEWWNAKYKAESAGKE